MIHSPVSAWVAVPLIAALATALWLLWRQRRRAPSSAQLILAAFRASPDAITISRLRDGMLLEVNRGFERLSGYRREEAVGRTTDELDGWVDSDRHRLVEALERHGRAEDMDFNLRRKSGELRSCRLSAEIIELDGERCLVAVSRDTTRQKEVERRLLASEQKFAKAFRSSPDAITISRLSDGTFLDVNEGFVRLSGFSYEEAVGHRAPELGIWGGQDRRAVVEALRRDGHIYNHEISYRVRSGEVRDFLLSAEIIELDGEPCMVAISRDVSELKRAEREREQLITRLEAQNAELERYAYTVSHDLKTPLVTIMGFAGLLARRVEAGDAKGARSALDRIETAASTMNRYLEELLDLSRVGRAMNPPEPVPLSELAAEAVRLLWRRIASSSAVVSVPKDLPVVHADRLRLLEVLQNLIENAVKFSNNRDQPRVEIGAREIDGEVLCSVRDHGIGIDPEYHERIFDLFERLDRTVEGTGVGLALVKRIVEVHGGRIWVESEGSGRGTTVWFTLPRQPPGATGTGEAG